MREKEENRRTQESFVGNLKNKKSVLFNEREQERRVMFGGIELSSMDMLTLNEYFKEDRAILLFFGGLLKEVFHQAIIEVVSRSLFSINFIF